MTWKSVVILMTRFWRHPQVATRGTAVSGAVSWLYFSAVGVSP